MSENFYRQRIKDMADEIKNAEYLMKVYYFIKVFWEDEKSGVDIDGTLKGGNAI